MTTIVTGKTRTITNNTANGGSVVETEFIVLYNNDQTLASAVDAETSRATTAEGLLFTAAAGLIIMYDNSTAPTGWVLCDGASYLRTGAYAALFAAIGTMWGRQTEPISTCLIFGDTLR